MRGTHRVADSREGVNVKLSVLRTNLNAEGAEIRRVPQRKVLAEGEFLEDHALEFELVDCLFEALGSQNVSGKVVRTKHVDFSGD